MVLQLDAAPPTVAAVQVKAAGLTPTLTLTLVAKRVAAQVVVAIKTTTLTMMATGVKCLNQPSQDVPLLQGWGVSASVLPKVS